LVEELLQATLVGRGERVEQVLRRNTAGPEDDRHVLEEAALEQIEDTLGVTAGRRSLPHLDDQQLLQLRRQLDLPVSSLPQPDNGPCLVIAVVSPLGLPLLRKLPQVRQEFVRGERALAEEAGKGLARAYREDVTYELERREPLQKRAVVA